MPKYFIVLYILFASLTVQAQTWEIGGNIGAAGYIGDLNINNPIKPSGGQAGLFIKRNFNRYLGLKLNYSFGQISGADSTSGIKQFQDRNLSFTTPLKELSLMAELNFMSFIPDAGKNKYTPYIYVGAGITSYNPQAKYKGDIYDLRPIQTEGIAYSSKAIVIPFGAGVKYNFSGKWTVAADLGYRFTNTDYLDDVSTKYANKGSFATEAGRILSDRSGEKSNIFIGNIGSQRGDYRPNDFYMFVGFTISYTFVTQACYY